MLKAYVTYVRSILEYGRSTWNPYLLKHINLVEGVQRFFTKRILCRSRIQFTSYQDRLYKLNIHSIEFRRMETDMVLTYKIIHNIIDLPMNKFFQFQANPYSTRSHQYCLAVKTANTEFQKNFFGCRVVPAWNRLPNSIVQSPTATIFRSKLKAFDLSTIVNFNF